MKYSNLLLLILVCFGLSACSNSTSYQEQQIHTGQNILKTFGDEDLERMQEFVDRFNDNRSDYVMAIPPIIDGGYAIYDLKSDGDMVTVRTDRTRDMYSGKESTFSCRAMEVRKDGSKQIVVLDKCEGLEEEATEVELFTFDRELSR
ncbi:DUF4362 domain-containing protein [Paenibacillus sp. SYP-B4298]|uniref:DUF4362 domain-containing protein n=1 Tax=Paenibacillus sp. SYP-B4298 TaxID=2996034 RepID=UPI0022DDA3BB|nr:DUF4362 domain-containing protein [Paenibacillus sp. SYP-B4298]